MISTGSRTSGSSQATQLKPSSSSVVVDGPVVVVDGVEACRARAAARGRPWSPTRRTGGRGAVRRPAPAPAAPASATSGCRRDPGRLVGVGLGPDVQVGERRQRALDLAGDRDQDRAERGGRDDNRDQHPGLPAARLGDQLPRRRCAGTARRPAGRPARCSSAARPAVGRRRAARPGTRSARRSGSGGATARRARRCRPSAGRRSAATRRPRGRRPGSPAQCQSNSASPSATTPTPESHADDLHEQRHPGHLQAAPAALAQAADDQQQDRHADVGDQVGGEERRGQRCPPVAVLEARAPRRRRCPADSPTARPAGCR